VTKSKSPSIVTISLGSGLRWVLLIPALLAILGAWFTVRWYVGNTIAEYAPDVTQGGIEMARMAVRWAPGDPLAHWRLGSFEEKEFSAENMAAAVGEYRTAVRLSPNDYRYWMEFGRALESSGDRESGEKALRRAVELAPAYSHPRWHFGNLLLREGKYNEAFEQLGHAAESDNEMRRQVFDLAMRVYAGDVDEIAKVACASPAARMQFANYLVKVERFDDAMRMWSGVAVADRAGQTELNKEFEQALLDAKQFHAVLTVMREIDPNPSAAQPEQIQNGGFESELTQSGDTFNWLIEPRASVQAALDSHAHSGQKSLRLAFRAPRSLEKIPISQTVVVEPGTSYQLECYVRAEDLISSSTPNLQVIDAIDGSTLGTSQPVPTGTSAWQLVTFNFATKPKHDGITIGLNRARCAEGQICPIFGTIWYDDFSIKRINGPGSPPRDAGSAER
jgi:Carbohydrate binding domain/Tetratricopeptide repeat